MQNEQTNPSGATSDSPFSTSTSPDHNGGNNDSVIPSTDHSYPSLHTQSPATATPTPTTTEQIRSLNKFLKYFRVFVSVVIVVVIAYTIYILYSFFFHSIFDSTCSGPCIPDSLLEHIALQQIESQPQPFDSFEAAMATSNDKLEQERQEKLQSEQIIIDSQLLAFLEPNYPARSYFIETSKYFSQGDFATFELSYNRGSGGDVPILLIQKTLTGYQVVLNNQQVLEYEEVDGNLIHSFQIDCNSLVQTGVPQNIYEDFLRLNSDVYGTSAVPDCQLAE